MKRMCCLCCKKIKSEEQQEEEVCEFTDLNNSNSSQCSKEITENNRNIMEVKFLFELNKIELMLKDNNESFDINKLYHSFQQSIVKYNNNDRAFNEIAFVILHEIIQLKSIHNNLLLAVDGKIQTHAQYLSFKQSEEEILEKSNIYLHKLKKIINVETNRETWINAKKQEKLTMNYMDDASQLTWKAKIENIVALTEYNKVFLTFSSKKEVIIGLIQRLVKKIDEFYFNI